VTITPKLSPVLEMARQILAESRKAMHVDDIAASAVRTNRNLQMDAETLAEKLSIALSSNVKSKSPFFAKIKNKTGGLKRGIYKIKSGKDPGSLIAKTIPAPPTVSNNFLGKAGEHAVMSELLFWGYNASLMTVDEGVDVVASKQNHYFHIQVKSAAESDKGKFAYKIKSTAFASNQAANTFYIFVMRRKGGSDFAILPSSHIGNLRGLGIISGTNDLSLTIACDERRRVFRLNNTDDISLWINNFSVIR